MKITVRCGNREALLECREGENLLSVLRDNGFNLSASCGGRGICGKCRIKVFGGKYGKDGQEVLACKTVAENGICIELNEANGGGLTEYMPAVFQCDKENGYGVAVDIGTTTLAFALCELGTGKTIKKCARLNRQAAFGADVISRIMAAEEGKAELLAQTVRGQIEGEISELCAEFHIGAVKRAAVCGNTTMLHLFCGENVSGIGRYPFTPQFTEFRSVSGREFGISVDEIQVLPSVSAFVGADIVAGCVALDIASKEAMLADIGTNGEMIAHKGGKCFVHLLLPGRALRGRI